MLFVSQGKIFLFDTAARKYEPVLTVTDQDVDIGSPSLSPDNKTLYFTFVAAEPDIWLMTLEQQNLCRGRPSVDGAPSRMPRGAHTGGTNLQFRQWKAGNVMSEETTAARKEVTATHLVFRKVSVASTRAPMMPGSVTEWPASGMILRSASGQARWRSQALMIGQTIS